MAKRSTSGPKILVPALVVGVIALGTLGFSAVCPCERTPGMYLFGSAADGSVSDWTFANDVTLCQIQILVGIRPHSINLNCMADPEGRLYLSCSQCDGKYWSVRAANNGWARLRLDGIVYPIQLTRVMDPVELDRAWLARVTKLNALEAPANGAPPPGTPRPDHWWSFRVASRS